MTFVFDHEGNSLPEFEGPFEKVLPLIIDEGYEGNVYRMKWLYSGHA